MKSSAVSPVGRLVLIALSCLMVGCWEIEELVKVYANGGVLWVHTIRVAPPQRQGQDSKEGQKLEREFLEKLRANMEDLKLQMEDLEGVEKVELTEETSPEGEYVFHFKVEIEHVRHFPHIFSQTYQLQPRKKQGKGDMNIQIDDNPIVVEKAEIQEEGGNYHLRIQFPQEGKKGGRAIKEVSTFFAPLQQKHLTFTFQAPLIVSSNGRRTGQKVMWKIPMVDLVLARGQTLEVTFRTTKDSKLVWWLLLFMGIVICVGCVVYPRLQIRP